MTPAVAPTQGPDNRLHEFFRFHGVWAPGVRLFRQLRFSTKALIISGVLLVPSIVLGAAFVADMQSQLAFSHKERDGVAAMHKLVPVLQGVLEARNATRASLGGHELAQAESGSARGRVDAALTQLEAHVLGSGDPLGLAGRVQALRQAWLATASSAEGVDAQRLTDFGPVTSASAQVLQAVTDDSNLVLDPDLDSLYTIMAVFVNLTKASEDLGQLWGWGTFAVAKGGLESPEQYRRYAIWSAKAGAGIEDALAAFQRATQANPALAAQLDLRGLAVAQQFAALAADPAEMIKAALGPDEIFKAGQTALQAYFGTYSTALPAIDGLLLRRLDGLETRRNVRMALALAALALAAYLFACFSKVIDGGLNEVAQHLDRIAAGDLTQSPRPWGKDEAAALMGSLTRMQDAMRAIVLEVRESSDAIVLASSEIAVGSGDLSHRTERAAAELQQTAASLDQITATLGQALGHAQHVSQLAAVNVQAAQRGGQTIERAVSTMADIDQASTRIGDITGTIDGIAFQTNILALNAAVEAARAGEHGRGFAVVAAEVRALALRSSAAAREIKSLITGTLEKVQSGSHVVRQAGQEMGGLLDSAGQISRLVADISVAAGEQNTGVGEVGSSVSQLDQMTQQNAALVEQTAAAAEALKQRALELAQAVAKFRLTAPAPAEAVA